MRRRELEIVISDWLLLKVSPIKWLIWFDMKGKISPKYVILYMILIHIGNMANELELFMKFSSV